MALVAGMRVGPYEVLDLLGAGGMGEVYRALDPRLGRQVALKVLPERFADSADRLRRFEREARSVGALSHPNILTVFDVGTHDGIPYLVSELLEGETVRAALLFQRFSVRQSLSLGLQVARGLSCAHEAGILHRDLKPENLFLARDGHLKILDFGLAKLVQPDGGASPEARTATRDTDEGRVAGTAAYMSPEQIRDEPLDERCDIFALGAILFELMSQRRAFAGPNPSDIMASILRDEPPPLAAAGAVVPPGVEAMVRRCLEKRREDRFGSAREVAVALQTLLHSLGREGAIINGSGAGTPIAAGRRRISAIAFGLALLVAAALGVPRALRSRGAPSASPPSPAEVPAAETVLLTSSPGRELEPALARDGQRVTFVWDGPEGDNFDLYTKVIGSETALRLTSHPAYDGSPAWSPDGRWIAFIRVEGSRGSLLLVPSTGGPERRLRDVDPWFGSSVRFSPDGRWVALSERPAAGAPFGVVLLAVDTRETIVLTRPDPSFAGDAFPAFSPNGQMLAFARIPAHGASLHWAVLSLVPAGGGVARSLAREDQVIGGLDWTRDGREIVFSASRGYEGPVLWRVPVAGGRQVPALGQNVSISNLFGAEALTQVSRFFRLSVAHDADRLAYAKSHYHTDIWQLDAVSARTPPRPLVASTQVDEAPQFSPDGRRIAFSSTRASKNSQIWICDAEGAGCAQLTTFKSSCGTPRWSPDGERLVFDAGETGQSELYVSEVVTGVSRRLTFHDASDVVPSWSRDGASIYFTSDRTGTYEFGGCRLREVRRSRSRRVGALPPSNRRMGARSTSPVMRSPACGRSPSRAGLNEPFSISLRVGGTGHSAGGASSRWTRPVREVRGSLSSVGAPLAWTMLQTCLPNLLAGNRAWPCRPMSGHFSTWALPATATS